jgi:hypothetical protein
MASLDPQTLDTDDLAAMLRAWAAGFHPDEAAVGLLIAHAHWLPRRDFRARQIDAVEDGWGRGGTVLPMASIAWDAVPTFLDDPDVPASSSEATVLRLAASLAGVTIGSVRDLTSHLDHDNAGLALDAIAHRCGWHEHGQTRTITGHLTPATTGGQP